MVKRIVRTLRWTLIVVLLALLAVRMSGAVEQLAYFPSRHLIVTPAEYEDIWITTPDGLTLHAWFMPAKGVPQGQTASAILHAHGNAGNIADHDTFSDFLTDAGFHVLLFDYRCYGRSDDQGPINRTKLAIDTAAALETLIDHPLVDPARIGVLGVSLGGPFALNAAANEPRVRAIATISTFSSWQGVAADMSLLGPLLMPSGLDAKDSIKHLNSQPYLIMHGLNDQVINPRHADILYQAATDAQIPATLKTYPGDHNSLVQRNAQARSDLIEFFKAHLVPSHSVGENAPMFKSKTHTPESFWKWFSKRSEKFLAMDGQELLNVLLPELTKYHDGLAILLSGGDSLPREFIISAGGISANVDAVEKLADAAPEIHDWKIIRFRPRFGHDGDGIQIGDVTVDIDAVKFVAFKQDTKIGLDIYAHWRKPEDGTDTDGPAFIMLDHTIGEYDVICGISFIDLHPLEDAPENARPWSEFETTFDRVYHSKED